MSALLTLLCWITWWGGVVLVIKIDQKRRDAAIKAEGNVNFEDKSVTPYLALGLLCGGLVLPVYFYATRKTGISAVWGVLWCLAVTAVTFVVAFMGVLAGLR